MARVSLLQLNDISLTFGGDPVFGGLDLVIQPGDRLALVGRNGSGKSTLMNILGFLDTPTSGEYWFDGKLMQQHSDEELAAIRNQVVGFVFQSFHLLPRLTAVDNVMVPLRFSQIDKVTARQRAEQMLQRVGLAGKFDNRPNEMSGGQRQRVAIARALVTQPKVIFADEPTGNLDTKTSIEIMELFSELHQQGQTIVFVTHEPEVADHAQRIIMVRDGEIIDYGY